MQSKRSVYDDLVISRTGSKSIVSSSDVHEWITTANGTIGVTRMYKTTDIDARASVVLINGSISRDELMSIIVRSDADATIILAGNGSTPVIGGVKNVYHHSDMMALHVAYVLSPLLRRLTYQEIEGLRGSHIDTNMLPRVSVNDPLAVWYGLRSGDIVELSDKDVVMDIRIVM